MLLYQQVVWFTPSHAEGKWQLAVGIVTMQILVLCNVRVFNRPTE